MSVPPLAHLGHWYVQIAFAAPCLVIISYMVLTSSRDRLRNRRKRDEPLLKEEGDS